MGRIRQSAGDRIIDGANAVFLSLCGLVVLYPLVFILSASFSSPASVVGGKVVLWPVKPSLIAYETLVKYRLIFTGYANSFLYTAAGTAVGFLMTYLAAYPLSRKGLPLRRLLMGLFVFAMLFNGGLIPTYLVVKRLGMVNTRWAIIIPTCISPWNIIIMRAFFQTTVPQELYDAAEMDGASELRIMLTIVPPLAGPIFAVINLYWAVWIWNSYYYALLYLRSSDLQPLQIILRQILIMSQFSASMMSADEIIRKQGLADVLRYALIVVASAPLLAVYPFIQKFFIQGALIGAVKG